MNAMTTDRADVTDARKRETRSSRGRLALYHVLLLGTVFVVWHLLTNPLLVSEEFADRKSTRLNSSH